MHISHTRIAKVRTNLLKGTILIFKLGGMRSCKGGKNLQSTPMKNRTMKLFSSNFVLELVQNNLC